MTSEEFKAKNENIMRLSRELYAAMKEMVDYIGDCTGAYVYGDVTKDEQFRPSIISASASACRSSNQNPLFPVKA